MFSQKGCFIYNEVLDEFCVSDQQKGDCGKNVAIAYQQIANGELRQVVEGGNKNKGDCSKAECFPSQLVLFYQRQDEHERVKYQQKRCIVGDVLQKQRLEFWKSEDERDVIMNELITRPDYAAIHVLVVY